MKTLKLKWSISIKKINSTLKTMNFHMYHVELSIRLHSQLLVSYTLGDLDLKDN